MVSKEPLPGVELIDENPTSTFNTPYVPPKLDKMQSLAQVTGGMVITGDR